MSCPRCGADLPAVAHFCHTCGQDLRTGDLARRKSFAVKPDEPVASFALISSIMPRGSGERPQTYRIALTIALAVALIAAIFGALPIAVLVAAFAIPIVYIVYIYDVNLWEDEPIPVTALAFVLTGVLAALFTALWTWLRGPLFTPGAIDGSGTGTPSLGTFLLVALVVPVVGEAIRQVGPIILASRPEFDDLMDGLTFGVISGVAYAAFDTIVRHWALLTGDVVQQDPGLWVSLIFLEGFVKPLIFGTATGIACAEFSGLGRGYDGFTPRYYRGLAEAVLA
ncbi:MAG: zinc ribbon domain-containing protein, partial [Propionibacteriaceae bacterium]